MRILAYLAAAGGVGLVVFLIIDSGYEDILQSLELIGWNLLWLPLFRIVSVTLDAQGWRILVAPRDHDGKAQLIILTWIALVREGVSRLLPIASVGGELVGIRLLILRGLNGAVSAASVIIEVLVTLISQYLFTAIGLMLLISLLQSSAFTAQLLWALGLTFPIPLLLLVLLRKTNFFQRLGHMGERVLGGRGKLASALNGGAGLDAEIRYLTARYGQLAIATFWQFAGMVSGSFEIWFVLWLLGHPIRPDAAIALESITLAIRHLAFLIPAGLGVQEAGMIVFGQMLGLDSDTALALSLVKRMREVMLGLPALLSWQYYEARHLKRRRHTRHTD